MYWLYGPRQFCNVDDGDIGVLSTDPPIHDHYDCVSSKIIKISTIGSLMLKYNPILSFNDVSNSAHTMSTEESTHRAALIRNSVRSLVIMINRQNFSTSICLNSALVILHRNILNLFLRNL